MSGETVLVTGGCGFIGSAVVRALLTRPPAAGGGPRRVINLDALTYCGNPLSVAAVEADERLGPLHERVTGDVRDGALVGLLLERCSAVIHAAAETHVDRSIASGVPFFESNAVGTQSLLEAAARAGFSGPIVLASTDEVYGPLAAGAAPFAEHDALRPSSPYAASKAAADLAGLAMRRTFGLDVRIVRGSNTYGPGQFPEKIVPLFVTRLLAGERVPVYGDGSASREWLHVEDHARALLAVLEGGRPGEVYHAGGGDERKNLELTGLLLEAAGIPEPEREGRLEFVADRPGHDPRYALDSSKLERELGWRPERTDLAGELAAVVSWHREHPGWWDGRA